MKIPWAKDKDKKDNSLGLFHGEAASSSIENAGCSFQSYSIIATGADASGVGILSILTNIVLSAVLIKVPSLIEGQQNALKKTTVVVATISAFTWLPIIFSLFFIKNVSPLFLIGLWIFSLVPTILLGPLRDIWLANSVPSDKMGSYLGWRSVITSAFFLVFLNLMAKIVDLVGGQKVHGYAIVLTMAFLASIVSIFFYTKIKTPVQSVVVDKETPLGFLSFLKQAKQSHLGVFILFIAMFTFSVNIAAPYFASYLKEDRQFSMATINVIISFEFIARIVSMAFWGKIIDRSGSLKILSTVTYFIPVIPILWMFSGNVVYLCMAQVFSGTVWSAFDLCVQTFIYKATSPSQRLRYIVYYRSLSSLSVAVGGFTGLLLINRVVPIFGSGIITLFLISGVLRLIVARVMIPKLSTEGIPGAIINEELANELAALEAPVFEGGLYYHPEAWGRFSRRAYIIGNSIGKTINKLNPVKIGLFYQPNQWSKFVKTTGEEKDLTVSEPKSGLYNNPKSWIDYMQQQAALQPVPANTRQTIRDGLYYRKEEWQRQNPQFVKRNTTPEIEKKGLFHNPGQWLDYLKQGMVLNTTTVQTAGGTSSRQPVYYHPEAWENYKKETVSLMTASARPGISHRQALLYHPEDWKRFSATPVSKKPYRAKPAARVPLMTSRAAIPVKRKYVYQPSQHVTASTPGKKLKLAPVIANN